MSVVHIISDHGKLNQVNETFVFTASDGTIRKIFPHKMDSLIIEGVVSISGRAFRLLAKHQINTLVVSSSGKYNGKLIFSSTKNVFLKKKQYALSDNENFALSIAKSIVLAKLYFSVFRHNLSPEWAHFPRRSKNPPLASQLSWQMIIIEQVKHLKRVILGEETTYKGYVYK